ncbi:DUF916 and DUF3324 domain-containing protein [Listeria grandensis]|uniref:DUF916 and DUF3324 domain-containing protein n=1 Tax=Listeria grandensis TaxID=1494963 RepID=UPI00164EA0AB|nr:DUF916 and DUF3324 domain-containing protein [Listeria grandensis]MBC6316635.1 DUF916 and DUF3324 domain-containing protein [Listeria grandensis]
MKIKSLVILFLLTIILIMPTRANASELSFSVQALLPENQINQLHTYFDLLMKPNQKQTIQVAIKNDKDEEIQVEVNANTAITNSNGIIEYTNPNPKIDNTLKTEFRSIVQTENLIIIPKNSTKNAAFTIQMPEKPYNGMILGGLHFMEKDKEALTKKTDSLQVDNRYSYTIGVVLQENRTKIAPDLTLPSVKKGQILGQNTIFTTLKNPNATILGDLFITASVYKQGETSPIKQQSTKNLRMAPNSNFDYAIKWDNQKFKPGKYKVVIEAKGKEKNWKLQKNFTITAKEAKIFNDKAINLKQTGIPIWLYIVGTSLVVLLVGFIAYRIGKRR